MDRGLIGDEIYALLFNLPQQQRRTALEYAQMRMAEDDRAQEAAAHVGPKPSIWALNGQPTDYWLPDLDEALNDIEASFGDIVEAAGYAVVEQKFLAIRMNDDGPRYETFDTRAGAEAYAAEMVADGKRYAAEQKKAGPERPEGMADDEALAFAAWWAGCLAHGCEVDESFPGESSESWLIRFRAKMTPAEAYRDAIPF